MIKPKLYKGQELTGRWDVTLKIDGVRALVKDGVALSRAGKPLYNLPTLADGDYEIYTGNWEATITAVRTQDGPTVDITHVYSLDPLDYRLMYGDIVDPTLINISAALLGAIDLGYEGVVLRQGDTWLKVKQEETYDVAVEGIQMGKGRHEGRMGALLTKLGKVGTGFTDVQREALKDIAIGTIIEVRCMQLTPAGKFRHPRFVRVREDK